jgi:hypothetical protein
LHMLLHISAFRAAFDSTTRLIYQANGARHLRYRVAGEQKSERLAHSAINTMR